MTENRMPTFTFTQRIGNTNFTVHALNCAPKNGLLATRKRTHIGSRNNFTVLRR